MIQISSDLIGWNNLWLILLAMASLMVLINKMDHESKTNNIYDKLVYGGLTIVSLGGLFYPIEFGLIGVNICVTFLLVGEFFRYDKYNKKNKW
jgi:hypothetical protein